MNVEKVKLNNINQMGMNRYPQSTTAHRNQVNFKGSIAPDVIKKEINPYMPKVMQVIYRLGSNVGELQDIVINAMGTGLIAPIFIKYNPLSKTDEDTRTYSAWRQPVSAVLAVVTQGFITIPFDRVITNMTNSGWFGDNYNKTPFKDESYIKKTVKQNNKKITKVELEKEIERIKKAQEEDLLNSIRKNNTINFQQFGNAKSKPMESKEYKQMIEDIFAELIENEKEERKKCNKVKLPQRIERSDYYRRNPDKTRKLLTEIQGKLNSSSNVKEIDKFLAKKEAELKGAKNDKSLLEIVQELRGRATYGNRKEILEELKYKTSKIFDHIKLYEHAKDKKEVEEIVKNNLATRKQELDASIKHLESLEVKIKKSGISVADIENSIKTAMKDCTRLEKYKDFAELVAEKFKSKINSNIKGFKRIASLIVAFAMLPVSCSLLNWVYPRFMDAVFPNLSNKKHSNEAHDYIDKANKNREVK